MSDQDLLNLCPVWQQPCLKDRCISYEVHTKQRFMNKKTKTYIPIDQIGFYSGMSQEELEELIERHVTITRECRKLGKIIEMKTEVDNLVPTEDE